MARLPSRSFRLSLIAIGLLGSGMALAEARIDPLLAQKLAGALPTQELQVVITYEQSTPVTAAQVKALKALGITKGVTMRTLPIAGALATPAEISALAQRDDVASVYFNAPLRYFNKEAREVSGAARVVENQADFGQAIPYSGRGVTVLVNDSGIDGTHEDVKFGENVVQNVLGAQNILAELATAVAPGIVPITQVEGLANTDLGSGHGTHCAGTIGGSGEKSGGLYRGVAPGADLVGYGSGAVLLILDAVGGLDYAATHQFSFDNPIRVTSNSWGSSGPFDPLNPVNVSTYELYKRGIVSVFAAGNDGPGEDTHNPYAQAPWVISVGAGEKDGVLTSFSSRGKRGESGTFTMPDGREWTYFNEPTIVATGVDIVSTRALTGALPPLAAEQDQANLAPAHLPFYTHMSGTSMATPHVAGIVALMVEANPHLTPAQIKAILEDTATNMTGRLAWEAGSGHVNAYSAVSASLGLRDYGQTVNALRTFNANAMLQPGGDPLPFSVFFSPVGEPEYQEFEVGADISWVAARATSDTSTIAIVLTDPDGVQYGSAIALPELGSTVTAGAPGKPGTWKVSASGIGYVSGVGVDPTGSTNGVAAPGQINGEISFLKSGGYTGLSDIGGHAARPAIEFAVANRLVDAYSDGKFRPDNALKRSELAQYLLMGMSVRQQLPLDGSRSFADLSTSSAVYGYAESAVAKGGSLRDNSQKQNGVMKLVGGRFLPTSPVTRLDLAYSLVQAQGLQAEAKAFTGPVTAIYGGTRVPVLDSASIPSGMRGYAQYALDTGVINARFAVQQGPYDTEPTVVAYFDPAQNVTRAAFAVAAGRYLSKFQSVED
jgi:serine protease AprX